ncbi:MAG TPA: N-acetyltransferase [Polyangia bacterium]
MAVEGSAGRPENDSWSAVVRRTSDGPVDRDRVVAMMVRAYHDDPLVNWVLRKDRHRDAAWSLFFKTSVELYLPLDASWVIESGRGCALWAPPDKWRLGLRRQLLLLPRMVRMLGIGGLGRGLGALARMEHQHPKLPHHYLYLLAVDPDDQGRGFGSALLESGLERVDQQGTGAFLETSNPRNLSLYQRHGFEVATSLQVHPSAPTVWSMWRAPTKRLPRNETAIASSEP